MSKNKSCLNELNFPSQGLNFTKRLLIEVKKSKPQVEMVLVQYIPKYQWRISGNVNNYIGTLATHSFQTVSRANASTNNNLALIRGPTS